MEQKIREICKAKNLKISELAERVGMGQSNLIASIRKNPKLSTLKEVCEALEIELYELFAPEETSNATTPTGQVLINGKVYELHETEKGLQLPFYESSRTFQTSVKEFIHTHSNSPKNGVIYGILKGKRYFHLTYYFEDRTFILTIQTGSSQTYTLTYNLLEFEMEESKTNLEEISSLILSDIEYYA